MDIMLSIILLPISVKSPNEVNMVAVELAHRKLGQSFYPNSPKDYPNTLGFDQVLSAQDSKRLDLTLTFVEGETAILPCRATQSNITPLPDKVVWVDPIGIVMTYGTRRIISDSRISVVRPMHNEWNLHIRNVKVTDEGRYSCQYVIMTSHVVKHFINLKIFDEDHETETTTPETPVTMTTSPVTSVTRATSSVKSTPRLKDAYYREQILTDRKWRQLMDTEKSFYEAMMAFLQKKDILDNQ